MKLQKLCYMVQADSLAENGEPFFDEDFYGWRNGVVCPELYKIIGNQSEVTDILGDTGNLSGRQKNVIDRVLEAYGRLDANELDILTQDKLWEKAKLELIKTGKPAVISRDDIQDYYKD